METSVPVIQEIAKMSSKARRIRRLTRDHYLIENEKNGCFDLKSMPKARESNTHFSIESLFSNVVNEMGQPGGEVYYSREGIVGYSDDQRYDRHFMSLTKSKPFQLLSEYQDKPAMVTQEDFVQLLKTTFRGLCDPAVTQIVSNIKFSTGQSSESNIKHAGVSISRSILNEATGVESLDRIEYVVFNVPVFLEIPETAMIEVHVKPYGSLQQFRLTTINGHIEAALRKAEAKMSETLTSLSNDKKVNVYYGNPK